MVMPSFWLCTSTMFSHKITNSDCISLYIRYCNTRLVFWTNQMYIEHIWLRSFYNRLYLHQYQSEDFHVKNRLETLQNSIKVSYISVIVCLCLASCLASILFPVLCSTNYIIFSLVQSMNRNVC